MEKKVQKTILIAGIAVVILILAGLYYYFFMHTRQIDNKLDFNKAMFDCSKAKYINDAESAVWEYRILGKEAENCVVNVKLISIKNGVIDTQRLEGKEMICKLPLRWVGSPETEIKKCSGELKEGMQEIMIEKMHSYISSNIQKVNQGFNAF